MQWMPTTSYYFHLLAIPNTVFGKDLVSIANKFLIRADICLQAYTTAVSSLQHLLESHWLEIIKVSTFEGRCINDVAPEVNSWNAANPPKTSNYLRFGGWTGCFVGHICCRRLLGPYSRGDPTDAILGIVQALPCPPIHAVDRQGITTRNSWLLRRVVTPPTDK